MTDTFALHDWVLTDLIVNWTEGTAKLTLYYDNKEQVIAASEISDVKIPKREDWGPSDSVYEVTGPKVIENGNDHIAIQMQSGDLIEIEAKSIALPQPVVHRKS